MSLQSPEAGPSLNGSVAEPSEEKDKKTVVEMLDPERPGAWLPVAVELQPKAEEDIAELSLHSSAPALRGLTSFVRGRDPETKDPVKVFPNRLEKSAAWTLAVVGIQQPK